MLFSRRLAVVSAGALLLIACGERLVYESGVDSAME